MFSALGSALLLLSVHLCSGRFALPPVLHPAVRCENRLDTPLCSAGRVPVEGTQVWKTERHNCPKAFF